MIIAFVCILMVMINLGISIAMVIDYHDSKEERQTAISLMLEEIKMAPKVNDAND